MGSLTGRKILVTGGAGFIGSELVRQLAGRGAAEVVVVDNLVNGRAENLADLPPDQVRLVRADIRNQARLAELLKGVEVVFHLACLGVRHSLHAPVENQAVNATATLGLLLLARAAGVARFVHCSSSEVYGTARRAPMDEDHPTFPQTVYGAAKLAGEAYARAAHQSHGLPAVIVRPFNTYGPRSHHEGDCGEVIPKFLLRSLAGRPLVVFGDGTQTRDFSYVSDVAQGLILAALAEEAVGRTINLGSGAETSVNDLAALAARTAGRESATIIHERPRPGDVLRLLADAGQARRLLGYRPQVGLAEGLARLRDWYLSLGRSVEELLAEEVVINWERPQ